jgi:RNA polymerase sigma-70 factor (ECF subfamily)
MVDHSINKDYLLAQKICKDLRARHNESILELYHEHHRFFLAFSRRRLYNPEHDQIESVVSQFWTELLDAKAICGYEGKASLRTYLLTILNRRIIDANRKFQRDMRFTELTDGPVDCPSDIPDAQPSPEDLVLQKEHRMALNKTLIQLSKISPRDAKLIHMRLNGLSYKNMAAQELVTGDSVSIELKRKINSIKKQFTRSKTGSLAKFKMLLEKNFKRKDMDQNDILN